MKVAVIGAGYVGLVTAVCLAERGHDVIVAEQSRERRETIKSGKAPFFEPLLDELLQKLLGSGKISAVESIAEAVPSSEVTFIAVGTPFDGLAIDLSQVKSAALAIGKALSGKSEYHVVAVKSTVVPGTTDTLVKEALTVSLDENAFGLCMNPEFLREGSAIEDFRDPDRIIIGCSDERSGQILGRLYEGFDCPVMYTSIRNAELTKYASNSLLALLISFSNELAGLCEAVSDTDIDIVMDGLHLDKRLSPKVNGERITPQILSYLRAGCGFGGSCLPKDVNALRRFADTYNVPTPLLDATMSINDARPSQVVSLLEAKLPGLKNREIALLGLAFKPNTDDVRDSPALKILEILLQKGCTVKAFDPMVSSLSFANMQKPASSSSSSSSSSGAAASSSASSGFSVKFCSSSEAAVESAEAVVIATSWPEFKNLDWKVLSASMKSPIIVDTRRQLSKLKLPSNVVYCPIGIHEPALNAPAEK